MRHYWNGMDGVFIYRGSSIMQAHDEMIFPDHPQDVLVTFRYRANGY
jgi:hypothetical protein